MLAGQVQGPRGGHTGPVKDDLGFALDKKSLPVSQ